MDYVVTLKGFRCFLGRFADACEFIRARWGSIDNAAESGVRLFPASRYQID